MDKVTVTLTVKVNKKYDWATQGEQTLDIEVPVASIKLIDFAPFATGMVAGAFAEHEANVLAKQAAEEE